METTVASQPQLHYGDNNKNEETYEHMKGGKGPRLYRTASGIMTRAINSMPAQQVDEKSLSIIVLFESCPQRSYQIMLYKARIIKGAEMTAKLIVNVLDKRF